MGFRFFYTAMAVCMTAAGVLLSGTAEAAPDCEPADKPTPSMTEGPYFKPGSPERRSLITPESEGKRLVITGYVLSEACRPVPNARIDFWQADSRGRYDNDGYTLRGHQFTAEDGGYRLETIVPGGYFGRTQHIHVKVQRPDGSVLTTQLFFSGSPGNRTDRIFDSRLVLEHREAGDGVLTARFNFIL